MLPKQYRLKKKDDFQRVYKKGRFFSFNGLLINFYGNNEPYSRFGFAVGKNYSKSAVERNRARRVLRSSILKLLNNIISGKDFVITLKKSLLHEKLDSRKATELLQQAFKKNNLLK